MKRRLLKVFTIQRTGQHHLGYLECNLTRKTIEMSDLPEGAEACAAARPLEICATRTGVVYCGASVIGEHHSGIVEPFATRAVLEAPSRLRSASHR